MSFGFKITNSNNETVVDDSSSILILSGTRTVNGALRTTTDGSSNYRYAMNSASALTFVQIPVGATVALSSNGIISDAGTLTFRDTKLISSVPKPTSGFGMVILNPSGGATFIDTEGMIGISEVLQLPAGGGSLACAKSWYALPMMQQTVLANSGQQPVYAEGIKRIDASNVQMRELCTIVKSSLNYSGTWTHTYDANPSPIPLDYYVLAGLS